MDDFRTGETWSEYCRRVIPKGDGCHGCEWYVRPPRCKLFDSDTYNRKDFRCPNMPKEGMS